MSGTQRKEERRVTFLDTLQDVGSAFEASKAAPVVFRFDDDYNDSDDDGGGGDEEEEDLGRVDISDISDFSDGSHEGGAFAGGGGGRGRWSNFGGANWSGQDEEPGEADNVQRMDLGIYRTDPDATVPEGNEGTGKDACLYVFSAEDVEVGPGQRELIPTGIAFDVPRGYYGQILPLASLAAKHGLVIVADGIEAATADKDLVLVALNYSDQVCHIGVGDCLARLVLFPIVFPAVHDMTP